MEEIQNKTVEVVDIQFRPGQKGYFFAPGDLKLEAGDHVIIDTARGAEFGICTGGNHHIPEKDVVSPLRSVLRRATAQDERAVEELQHMQKTTESICAWLEAHPESLPKARRFAEYYIPTTLKLLHTYNDVQSQQGENAEAIRRDIAGILHTLNQAYDNLYDKLLSDVALDVSSESAALQGMLANDGLAGEGLR